MVNFKVVLLLLTITLLTGCDSRPRLCSLTIINTKGEKVHLKVEVADNDEFRTSGLMNRKKLRADSGMLFIFPNEVFLQFWMKDTYIPLDIAFISKRGIINEFYAMKPLDISTRYQSTLPAQYALEVNRGWFEKKCINRGSRLILNGCIGKQNSLLKR
jgi:uncharacterized membrane protein (UPF0127 family)